MSRKFFKRIEMPPLAPIGLNVNVFVAVFVMFAMPAIGRVVERYMAVAYGL